MSAAPLVDTTARRAAGRHPPMPCRVRLTDGRELELLRSLRVLPGRRVVAEGRLGGHAVLVKMFIADAAARHLQRERDGIAALSAAGIATPEIIAEGRLDGGGLVLLTRFLASAASLDDLWKAAPRTDADETGVALLTPALAAVGSMHRAGLSQHDLHLGNFLIEDDRLFVIDGDAIDRHAAPLPPAQATANLAILLAQLPPGWDVRLDCLVAAYRATSGITPDEAGLAAEIRRVRAWRLNDLLKKSVRDCSLFAVRRTFTRFTSVLREAADDLASRLAAPDAAIARGRLLKDGNSATVALSEQAGRAVVIKRYNLKSAGHALSRLFRPSRAWNAWQAAIRLRFLGVATPEPLALVEERLGPLRRRAWLITAFCPGEPLDRLLSADDEPPAAIGRAVVDTFTRLHSARLTHGDLKATNLLWDGKALNLIDLDATAAHRNAAEFARSWRRDRARLLRNWPADSVLARWLDEHLPAA
ncbi:MAG: lipopolysaccharide kinase InaA family protein [Zoogloeaceae bacterium]|nr:lipopolysaccharide kinase InaA family protein [Zoogloeaceae bacterium]